MCAPTPVLLRALRRATSFALESQTITPQTRCPRISHLTIRRQQCQTPHFSHRAFSTTPNPRSSTSAESGSPTRTPPPSIQRSTPPSSPRPPVPSSRSKNPYAPTTSDRGPKSEEKTQTDFATMDIYASAGIEEPATSIDACTLDGFHLNNGVITEGNRGVMLLGGEGFVWAPWNLEGGSTRTGMTSGTAAPKAKGPATPTSPFTPFLTRTSTLNFPPATLSLLSLLFPKPDLLIFGTGARLHMLSKETRRYLSEELGVKVDVMDTANAAAAYNLLVMERGVEGVGAVLVPRGFRG